MQWTKVSTRQPTPHRKYLLKRGEFLFTVTPCYGMHKPWWVPVVLEPGKYEGDPVDMLDTDEWVVLDEVLVAISE